MSPVLASASSAPSALVSARSSPIRSMMWWPIVLSCAPDIETAIVADLDFDTLESVRNRIPALRHRRPDVYGWKL